MRLELFGGVELTGVANQRVASVLRQRKQMALIIHLMVACPPDLHPRDELARLFWPHLRRDRARHALRQMIYTLRKTLGPRTVIVEGDANVGIARSRLSCDVVEFETAFDEARFEDAAVLYGGEFAKGLVARDVSPDFETWLVTKRTTLRRMAAESAWRLAEDAAARGDGLQARRWLRNARELAPLDEPLLRRTIAILDHFGDRAGAVHAYERFETMLRDRLAVEPSPETRGLIGNVRSRLSDYGDSVHAADAGFSARPPGS